MNQNWVITKEQTCFLWYVNIKPNSTRIRSVTCLPFNIFSSCTYMIFWHCTVKNGHINLHWLWYWYTLIHRKKHIWTAYEAYFCCNFSLIPIFGAYFHGLCMLFEVMSEIITFHPPSQKRIYLPQYVYVNCSTVSFMN